MLERLHIRKFRGLHDLKVKGLDRVNVVAGRNNAGKTTLLEAIFLLTGAANPRHAVNGHVVRMDPRAASSASIWESFWAPMFFDLNVEEPLTVSGYHSVVGDMTLSVALARPVTTEMPRGGHDRPIMNDRPFERALRFTYTDPRAGQLENQARETAENVEFDLNDTHVPFGVAILQPRSGNVNEDAVLLGRLRKQKRGDLLLEALRVLEPRLQAVEDSASSGAPMIWVDIGLRELVPLPTMGAGLTHVTRMVLAAAMVPDGVVLVDEIENGLHHSVLHDVWRVIGKTAEQFNVQFFATTHSFECVQAAHKALGSDGFRLHRLDIVEGENRCVTYGPEAIDAAIRHNLEVR